MVVSAGVRQRLARPHEVLEYLVLRELLVITRCYRVEILRVHLVDLTVNRLFAVREEPLRRHFSESLVHVLLIVVNLKVADALIWSRVNAQRVFLVVRVQRDVFRPLRLNLLVLILTSRQSS